MRETNGRWPTGHIGWVYRGRSHFEAGATTFLAEGAARGERLLFVADDPSTSHWPGWLLEQRLLRIASTAEVYGPDGVADVARQRAAFEAVLDEALAEGYSGLRAVADNTTLVSTGERLASWVRWETIADTLIASNPITAMCAFDESRAPASAIDVVMGLHPKRAGA